MDRISINANLPVGEWFWQTHCCHGTGVLEKCQMDIGATANPNTWQADD